MNHVVQFDFPTNLPDYLHRVGRTGRVGSLANNCRATAFMTHRRDIRMAWKIKVCVVCVCSVWEVCVGCGRCVSDILRKLYSSISYTHSSIIPILPVHPPTHTHTLHPHTHRMLQTDKLMYWTASRYRLTHRYSYLGNNTNYLLLANYIPNL